MNTIKVRPVLVETKVKNTNLFIRNNRLYYTKGMITSGGSIQGCTINLISLEDDKIEVGTKVACFENKELTDFVGLSKVEEYYGENQAWCYDKDDKSTEHPLNYQFFVRKVVATQDQLSPELIQQLIDEYNLLGRLRDFEIEMEYTRQLQAHNNILEGEELKLTNGFVTVVVEKERGITITRVEEETKYPYNLLCNMQYYMEYCQENGYVTPQEWLSKFKHYTDRKEPILYTEEEVLNMLDKYDEAKWGCPARKGMEEITFWFNKNKKK